MTPTLLIDLISEQRFFISNLSTFFGTPGTFPSSSHVDCAIQINFNSDAVDKG